MTCGECEEILLDLSDCVSSKGWLPGASVLDLAKSHAQDCPVCAAQISSVSKVNDALDQFRFSTMRMEAPPRVERNLVAEFHSGPASRVRTFRWRLVWGASAALLLVVVGTMFHSTLRPRSSKAVPTERKDYEYLAQKQLSPIPSGATADGDGIENHLPNADRIVTGSPAAKVAKLEKSRHEPMRGGLLPGGDQLSLNGGSNVVRVRLPLSSLVAVGVPVSPDVSNRRVTADVMMDPFGAVVAIHLVQVEPSMN